MAGKQRHSFLPDAGKSYLLLKKPFGVMSQFTQPDGSDKPTLAEFGLPADVYPVGRLDYDSEGLIVLTDDPRLNQLLLDPHNGHDRTYLAQVERVPTPDQLEKLRRGIIIDRVPTLPARAELVGGEPDIPERPKPIRFRKNVPTAWVKLVLQEGKNHQVRRMTAAVGCPTLRLIRVEIGRLNLFSLALQPGDWLRLNKDQIALLFARADDHLRIPRRTL
jgi:23S rRNA pseudouridine2457 synthase